MNLTDEHILHLDNIANGGLLRKVIPENVEKHLLKHGFIQKVAGGLMATHSGYKILSERS